MRRFGARRFNEHGRTAFVSFWKASLSTEPFGLSGRGRDSAYQNGTAPSHVPANLNLQRGGRRDSARSIPTRSAPSRAHAASGR